MTRARPGLLQAAALAAGALLACAAGGESPEKPAPPLDENLLKRLPAAFARADLIALVKVTEVGEAKPPGEGLEGDEAQFAQIFGLPNMWDKIRKRQVAVEVETLLKGGKEFKDLKQLKFRVFSSKATGKELSLVVADAAELAAANPFKAHYRKPAFAFTLAKGEPGAVFLKAAEKKDPDGKLVERRWSPAGPLMGAEAGAVAAAVRGLLKQVAEWEDPPKLSPADQAAVRKLIAELGDGDFKVRDAASKALVARGCAAKPLVQAALEASPDPEVKSRAEQVLEALKPQPLKADETGEAAGLGL